MQPWVALERLYSGLTKSYLLLSLVGRDQAHARCIALR